MSLHIVLCDEVLPKKSEIIWDIDAYFAVISWNITADNKAIIEEIDRAIPSSDGIGFIDRFGNKLPWDFLSTGSKAGIIIPYTSKYVWTMECGYNALISIITHLTDGNIIMQFPYFTIPAVPIDVVLHNKHFTDGDDLDDYFKEECF